MDKKKNRNIKASRNPQKLQEKCVKSVEESFDEIFIEDYYGKDFQFLIDAPVSENDHFVFKSEKSWTIDVNKYSEFFELDLKKLSSSIEALPFNDCIGIENRYFTSDQLTNIGNKATKGREDFSKLMNLAEQVGSLEKQEEADEKDIEGLTEELDFLLALQEPVSIGPTLFKQSSSYGSDVKSSVTKKDNLDLEQWLDSVLED